MGACTDPGHCFLHRMTWAGWRQLALRCGPMYTACPVQCARTTQRAVHAACTTQAVPTHSRHPGPAVCLSVLCPAAAQVVQERKAAGLPAPRVLYTIPTAQNPTGTTTSTERKSAIYQVGNLPLHLSRCTDWDNAEHLEHMHTAAGLFCGACPLRNCRGAGKARRMCAGVQCARGWSTPAHPMHVGLDTTTSGATALVS
jgi:hypothetical protein